MNKLILLTKSKITELTGIPCHGMELNTIEFIKLWYAESRDCDIVHILVDGLVVRYNKDIK